MRYFHKEISIKELMEKMGVSQKTCGEWRKRIGLPKLISQPERTIVPPNFKEEYTKFINNEITKEELCIKFNISESTYQTYRKKLSLLKKPPRLIPRPKRAVPPNFKEEYLKYYHGKIKYSELLKKFNMSSTLCHVWRDELKLPTYKREFKIPVHENFLEEYAKYCAGEFELTELLSKFNITCNTYKKWKQITGAQPHGPNRVSKKIPDNFREEYMKFYRHEITMSDLCDKFHVSAGSCNKWRKELGLPVFIQWRKLEAAIEKEFKEAYLNKDLPTKELLKKFQIGTKAYNEWKKQLNLNEKRKRNGNKKELPIPINFKEEYMKYYRRECNMKSLCEKFDISDSTCTKWRKKLNLPSLINIEIPANFKEEYMKLYNKRIKMKNLHKNFHVSTSTIRKWRDQLNLPKYTCKKEIPENFKEEYMRFYNEELTLKGICKEFDCSETLMREWRDKLGLPKYTAKKEIPEDFEEEYMKYYNREISQSDLRKKFDISERLIVRWRNQLNLPIMCSRQEIKIPENFEEEYIKFCNKKLTMKELRKKFNVSDTTCRKWRDKLNLPIVEKCRQGDKRSYTMTVNLSDNFDDFIEY